MSEQHLVFHPAVTEDLESILAYYAERDPALSSRFRARLKEQADRLMMFPESGAILFESYRRVLLKRFPYMVVYLVTGGPDRRARAGERSTRSGVHRGGGRRPDRGVVPTEQSANSPQEVQPRPAASNDTRRPCGRVCAGQAALSGKIKR
jgi:plasmid stabilization system protein ParE